MQVLKTGRNVHTVKMDLGSRNRREFWFLLRSDAHHDNLHCNWKLEKKHLDEAKKRKAGILDFGDLYCAMQGKWDKRSDKEQMRPEHQVNNYLDALVQTATDFYEPYAKQFVVLGYGNHEISILDRHSTDLLQSLASRLNDRTGSHITTGGLSGYVRFRFSRGPHSQSKLLWYHHGSGGASPITKGVGTTARHAAFVSDADIVCTGHTHTEYIVPLQRVKLSASNRIEKTRQTHIRIPGYKDSWHDGAFGWENLRGFAPTTVGACWLQFVVESDHIETNTFLAT